MQFQIRSKTADDNQWLIPYLKEEWGSTTIVTRMRRYDAPTLPGYVGIQNGAPAGIILYRISDHACQIILLASFIAQIGIGSALIETVRRLAVAQHCQRLWLITTNDNLPALRFYQKRGFSLAAFHRNALAEARKLKPEIPVVGCDGIPLRDELELEMMI